MYDRKLPNPRPFGEPKSRIRHRFETLVGITGARMAQFRDPWLETILVWFKLVWRPHLLGILWFEVCRHLARTHHALTK